MKKYLIFCICLLLLACQQKTAQNEFPPLFPFVISYDGPDNATSVAHLIEAPAGKHGFIRVENGHFAKDAGPIRFHATGLSGPANFPSHEAADKLASRLARLGINCVRHHFMDTWYTNFMTKPTQGILTDDTHTRRNLDPIQLDKLDYLIFALKKHGIYSNLNLHVGRTLDERDGFENSKGLPWAITGGAGFKGLPWANKGIDHFEPRMIELQKEYAFKLLTHVNPYTGNAYTNEPSIAMIEINNESSLFSLYYTGVLDTIPDPYFSELRKQWNKWLHKKYSSAAMCESAWQQDSVAAKTISRDGSSARVFARNFAKNIVPPVKCNDTLSVAASKDYFLFLQDVDQSYWMGMYQYIKKELKAKAPVSGTQLGYAPAHIMAGLDYVDNHAYWRHPGGGYKDRTGKIPWTIDNDAMINSLANIKDRLAVRRVNNKPYTISEYNHPYPNQYGAEGQPLLCIYGRLQGWDGVFQHVYNHDANDFEPQANPLFNLFACIARTDVLAHFPACAAIFLRGDVQEAKESVIAAVDIEKGKEWLADHRTVSFDIGTLGFDARLSLVHQTALDFTGKGIKPENAPKLPEEQKVLISDTKEITWNTEKPDAAYLAVNTANTKFFTGFPEGRTIEMGKVQLKIGKTRLNWATVSLVSRNATGFGDQDKPANILLAATGDSGNSGRVVKPMGEKKITLSDRGSAPVLVEGIPAIVIIPSNYKLTKCYALDPNGDRKMEIPVKRAKSRASEIILKPEYETIWYEIDIQF